VVARFLVTTALEDTWPAEDVPVLFLGEWCRLYDRKSVWEKRDAVVAPYHWDDRQKLRKDYLYLKVLYEELLAELVTKLNKVHGVNYSVRYWRIIAGPWLGFFIQMLFDRWTMLCQVAHANDISGVRVRLSKDEQVVPNDMAAFVQLFLSDTWNETIYGQLLSWMDIPVKKLDAKTEMLASPGNANAERFAYKFKHSLARMASHLSGAFCRDNEYFFIASYLPLNQDLLLQFKLGQLPKLWRPVAAPAKPANPTARQWGWAFPDNADDFPAIVRSMIPRHIPTAYLEGYSCLVATTKSLRWPKRPKAIFTSNSYCSDDVFKVWAADRVENGTPLIIGQHGGNFGMAKWSFTEDHQAQIADKFLTWGWSDKRWKSVLPVGNLKGFGRSVVPDERGMALLVQMAMPRYSYHMYSIPVSRQWLSYFDDQCRFVKSLPKGLQEKILVRLYIHDYGWGQKKRWIDNFPSIQIDDGSDSMASLMKRSRLYISTYNATTYLESLSLNFPTLIFWNKRHSELRPGVEPDFEMLRSVGIFHDTPESAAHHMQSIWGDVAAWWSSASVQSARQRFCERYALIPQKPIDVMETVFRKIADSHSGDLDSHIDTPCQR